MKTHFTWSIEKHRGRCQACSGKTVLVTFGSIVDPHEGDDNKAECKQLEGGVEIHEELSGHFCPKCHKLTSLSLNT